MTKRKVELILGIVVTVALAGFWVAMAWSATFIPVDNSAWGDPAWAYATWYVCAFIALIGTIVWGIVLVVLIVEGIKNAFRWYEQLPDGWSKK